MPNSFSGRPESGPIRPDRLQLEAREVERKTDTLKHGWAVMPSWVFYTETGTPVDGSKVRKVFRRALRRAGLPLHFTPHCLRHTFASLMLQQSESPQYVQRQLGHSSITLTVDLYGKWLPTGNKAAVNRLRKRKR